MILGPTGSGKTSASLRLAQAVASDPEIKFAGAEIISADSRAIYKGADLGTAKPTSEEQKIAPHWGLDLVDLGEKFNVADWKNYAETKICEISDRGNLPLVVGGTGLYIDAVVYGYSFTETAKKSYADRTTLLPNFLIFGVEVPREQLRNNLKHRIEQMFCPELFAETKEIIAKTGENSQIRTADIYRFAKQYLEGKISLEEAKEQTFYADWHLARRQMTWFRRTPEIIWLPPDKICDQILKYLKKHYPTESKN